MSWPDDEQLPIGVYAAFGANLSAHPATWVWTDLTDRLEGNPIPIRRGASDGAGEPSAGSCTLLLRNDDGALTPLNPMSTYYPNVDLNTPIMVDVRRITPISDSDAFGTNSTNSLSTSDQGRTWQTFGAGGTILTSDYQVTGGVATLSVPTTLAYRAGWIALNAADVDVTLTVSAAVTVAGGPIEPGGILMRVRDITHYYMCRLSVAVGGAITAGIYATGASELLASAVVSGVTWATGVPLKVRAQCLGTWVRMKVWPAANAEPATWTVTAASTDYLSAGGVGFRSGVASGNSNTKPIVFSHDNFTVTEMAAVRMDGFADSWEPSFIPTSDGTFVSGVALTASGILRRLGQGAPDGRSALYRAYADSGALAWWPLEDGSQATQGASGIPGQPAMDPSGTGVASAANTSDTVEFGVDAGASGAASLVSMVGGGFLSAPIPPSAATSWRFDISARLIAGSYGGLSMIPITWFGGTASAGRPYEFNILFTDVHTKFVGGDALLGGGPDLAIEIPPYDSILHHYTVEMYQSGADVFVYFHRDGVLENSAIWSAITLPRLSAVELGYYGHSGAAMPAVVHCAVFAPALDTVGGLQAAAVNGHAGETAADRIARVCAAANIPVLIDDGDSEPLGPQPQVRDVEIIRDAARADMGLLSEYLFGLRFRPRSTRYNLPASMTVDLAEYLHPGRPDDILAPVYDDQSTRNDWTVKRTNGSSGQDRDAAHIARYGYYDDTTEVNVATDGVLDDQAGFRVHLGTWLEMRYPTMPLHLEANLGLLEAWLALRVGDRADRTNVPAQHPPGPIEQIVYGYSEILEPKKWTVSASCAPYGPWKVAVVGGVQRVAALGSTLAAGIDDDDLALSLASTAASGLWRTTASIPASFPVDLRIGGTGTYGTVGGEIVTASVISGGSSPQPVTLSARGVNGVRRSWPAGSSVQVAYPARLAL